MLGTKVFLLASVVALFACDSRDGHDDDEGGLPVALDSAQSHEVVIGHARNPVPWEDTWWGVGTFTKRAGMHYKIVLQTIRGNFNLYGHYNADFMPEEGLLWSAKSGREVDSIEFDAKETGDYHVLVYARTGGSFFLIVDETESQRPASRPFIAPDRDLTWVGPYNRGWHGHNTNHLGQDYPGAVGEQVVSIADGVVATAGTAGGFGGCDGQSGGYVIVEHRRATGETFHALYGHVSAKVSVGDTLQAGDAIGTITSYPCMWDGQEEDWSHLHFGIWNASSSPSTPLGYGSTRKFVNPETFLEDYEYSPFPW